MKSMKTCQYGLNYCNENLKTLISPPICKRKSPGESGGGGFRPNIPSYGQGGPGDRAYIHKQEDAASLSPIRHIFRESIFQQWSTLMAGVNMMISLSQSTRYKEANCWLRSESRASRCTHQPSSGLQVPGNSESFTCTTNSSSLVNKSSAFPIELVVPCGPEHTGQHWEHLWKMDSGRREPGQDSYPQTTEVAISSVEMHRLQYGFALKFISLQRRKKTENEKGISYNKSVLVFILSSRQKKTTTSITFVHLIHLIVLFLDVFTNIQI